VSTLFVKPLGDVEKRQQSTANRRSISFFCQS
jgi:hypothetical protein